MGARDDATRRAEAAAPRYMPVSSVNPADVGLCEHCEHAKHVQSARGSVFWLCLLHDRDARFAKYPRLPVLQCAGYEPKPGC